MILHVHAHLVWHTAVADRLASGISAPWLASWPKRVQHVDTASCMILEAASRSSMVTLEELVIQAKNVPPCFALFHDD